MRLNKYLALSGVTSRRGADDLISAGQIKVNGQVVKELGIRINPDQDKVEYAGEKVEIQDQTVVYLLNKPRGVITTASDPHHRQTVLDFVPKNPRVFACGRLDEDTMGLVILTNDGNLCYQLTHPKFEHQKEYVVHGRSKDPQISLNKIRRGVTLNDGPIKVDALTVGKINKEKLEFTVTVHEGRNRLVRRLCAAVGIEIDSLTRIRVGKYQLGDLEPGKYAIVSG